MAAVLERTATINDLVRLEAEGKSCEIVRGVIVEKPPMGMRECLIAGTVTHALNSVVQREKLGLVFDSHGKYRLERDPDLVRMPDVSFVRWEAIPEGTDLTPDALDLAPDLAVEVINPTNRAYEIQEKLTDYFDHGVRLVWLVYPDQQLVHVYDAVDRCRILKRTDTLDGGNVLPNFSIRVADLFASLQRPAR